MLVGFSMKQSPSNARLGYHHDYGNPHIHRVKGPTQQALPRQGGAPAQLER